MPVKADKDIMMKCATPPEMIFTALPVQRKLKKLHAMLSQKKNVKDRIDSLT